MDKTKAIAAAFDELAPHYEQAMDQELKGFLAKSYDEFIERFLASAQIRAQDFVLDVATGTGRIPRALVDRSKANRGVVGLDVSPAMLERAQAYRTADGASRAIYLVCASGTAMAFAVGTFDAVTCGFGVHHMEVPALLSEVRRVLRDGGRLVLAEAGAPVFWRAWWGPAFLWLSLHLYGLFSANGRARVEMEAVSNMHTAGEWRTMLAAAGFTNINVREERSRRAWYPRALDIQAVARQV